MSDMIGDDTGDNISEKNPTFCELTALYWAWMNLHDVEYIGLEHYRRQFNHTFTAANIDCLFSDGTDVILAGPMYRRWRWEYLKTFVCNDDLAIMISAIRQLCPEYGDTIANYANGFIDYPLNMFVCRKALFDRYAAWLFPILFECEKQIKPSPYSRARRVYGYLAEFLMPTFFMHNKCKIKALQYVFDGTDVHGGFSKRYWLKRRIADKIICADRHPHLSIDYSIRAGLGADGLTLK